MSRREFGLRFLACAPLLMNNEKFKARLATSLPEDKFSFSAINPSEALEEGLDEYLYDAYLECAQVVLSLGWDGDAPGLSGGLWVYELEGIFIITSSDYDDMGPFNSLDEVLDAPCFGPTAKPELDSTILPNEKLLEIGRNVIFDDQTTIRINGTRYRKSEDRLVQC